jgi:hypothetical protein
MATMFPKQIDLHPEAQTAHKRVFEFIRSSAKPDKDFLCWHRPPLDESQDGPDFVLFGRTLGLLVIEVCDWTLSDIVKITPFTFSLVLGRNTEKVESPDRVAKRHAASLQDRLLKIPELCVHDPSQPTGLKIPIGRLVVFLSIPYHAFSLRGFHWLLPRENALFQEDLEYGGIIEDRWGTIFRDRVLQALPFRFRGLNSEETEKVVYAIWSDAVVELPRQDRTGKASFLSQVEMLDRAQSRAALRLKKGHQVIKGPPGSGKTLLLVHRCCHLLRFDPSVKQILFVCYNIALVNYLRALVQEKGFTVGHTLKVCHFFELCGEIVGRPVYFENQEEEYYDSLVRESLAMLLKGIGGTSTFDALFIDEGQDFSSLMIQTLLELLKPGGDMVIALDPVQDLYRRKVSWKSLGVRAAGRTRTLKTVYRTTRALAEFSSCFIGKHFANKDPKFFPPDHAIQGEPPLLKQFGSMAEIEAFLVKDILERIGSGEYHPSEIAVIYDDKVYGQERFGYDNRALPMRILGRIKEAGAPISWVSQDVRAKTAYDINANSVSLISIHSAKGLEFDLVYLLGMDRIIPKTSHPKRLTALVYVGITRARFRLIIPYLEHTALISHFKDCLSEGPQ